MLSLTQFLERAQLVNRDGPATIYGERQRTWPQIADRVARAAGALAALGLGDNERVAILGPNSDTYLECLFSIPWAGGVAVPINTRLAAPEIVDWLEDSGAKILLVDDPLVQIAQDIRERVPTVEHIVYIGGGKTPNSWLSLEGLIAEQQPAADAQRSGSDLFALFYTGGTTGRSKGVMITHEGLYVNILQWIAAVQVTQNDRFLVIPPMFHAAGGENSLAVAALAATAVIMPQFDVLKGLETIQRERVTKIPLVATMLDMMVNHPSIGEFDLTGVTRITYGASPISEKLLLRALEVFPHAKFFQVFGQTEGGPTVAVLPAEYHVTEGPLAGKMKSAGRAVIGVDISILDEQGNPQPAGTNGEIAVRGPGVSPGYWNLPEVTAAALHNGWLRTGDAGYLDEDGFVYIADRIKDMIISGGENVYPAEVELALLRHPGIAECAVIGIPSEQWGEQVHGIVRLADGHSADEAELLAHCREHLAGYKCVRSVEFREEPFPLSATNKVLKRELRKPYWEKQDRAI